MDEAILDAVSAGIAPPTLRIYTFSEPTVTVGRHQDAEAGIDIDACDSAEIPVVRRPTGGRGVLHVGDIIVTIVTTLDDLPPERRGVKASYEYLSSGFVEALRLLGIGADMGDCERSKDRSGSGGDCFAARSRADVVSVRGQKIVGSAQRRRGGLLLQQSSVRHRRPDAPLSTVFKGPPGNEEYPLENISEPEITAAFIDAFASVVTARFQRFVGPSAWEEERCAVLLPGYAPLSHA